MKTALQFLFAVIVAVPATTCDTPTAIRALVPAGSNWAWNTNDLNSVHFTDGNPATPPTAAQINAQIATCQSNANASIASLQNDISTINSSTATVLESAIIDVLKQKGLLTAP